VSSRGIAAQLTIGTPLNQRRQVFAGALRAKSPPQIRHTCQQRKTLEGHCWLC